MPSTIASRLSQIIEYKGTNVTQFERSIGASSGVIRKAIAQNSDIQSKWLTAISENYPDISPLWILTGRGGMLCDSSSVADNSITHSVIGNRGSVKIAMHGTRIANGNNPSSPEQLPSLSSSTDELLASKDVLIASQKRTIDILEELIRTKEAQISELIQAVTSKP